MFTGGAAKGRLWPQIVADVLGVTVHVPVVKESTALGAAMFAGLGAGLYDDLAMVGGSAWSGSSGRSNPDQNAKAAYDEHFDRWTRLYPRILDLSETGLLRPMWWPAGA